MFEELVQQAYEDMFEHLGYEVIFRPRDGEDISILAVIKQPENAYLLGDSPVVDQVAEIAAKSEEISPKIGDYVIHGDRKYKIYSEPLLDASTLAWKFLAVLVEDE